MMNGFVKNTEKSANCIFFCNLYREKEKIFSLIRVRGTDEGVSGIMIV
jgi:hypothetical protein